MCSPPSGPLTRDEAILAIGAVAVLLNSWWQEDELEYSLRGCKRQNPVSIDVAVRYVRF